MTLRLGIVGLSDGNGHPYSWAAIFNGYDSDAMADCGFPVIPQYLAQQTWPDVTIAEARVTHVWTQDSGLSAKVARAARIPHVADRLTDMVGSVDGLLLARDDAKTHYEIAKPFLEAGLPIYIDKPICLSLAELDRIYALQRYPGQIFTCSALRYGSDFVLSDEDREAIGPIHEIHGITPKYWDTYAAHVIESVLALAGDVGSVEDAVVSHGCHGGTTLTVRWKSGFGATVSAMGKQTACPLTLRVMGARGWRDLVFVDSFNAFRAALFDFVQGVLHRDVRSDPAFVRRVVETIELGRVP